MRNRPTCSGKNCKKEAVILLHKRMLCGDCFIKFQRKIEQIGDDMLEGV